MAAMRWDAMFADLEGQAEALATAERAAEVETHTRGEVGRLTLIDRLRAALDTPLRLRISGGGAGAGRVVGGAPAHVLTVRGRGRYSAVPGSGSVIDARLGLASALRGIARDRAAVRLHL